MKPDKRISQTQIDMVNELIAFEAFSSFLYLDMAYWCLDMGYINSGKFFKKKYEEEKEHMIKNMDFLNDRNVRPMSPKVPDMQEEYKELKDLFLASYNHEVKVTALYYEAMELIEKEKCYATRTHLNGFLNEQIEEEAEMNDLYMQLCNCQDPMLFDLHVLEDE